MPAHIDELQTGQDVYSLDGELLGTVSAIWRPRDDDDAVEGMTPGAGDFGRGLTNTVAADEARVLESVEARGTNAGDIGLSSSTASTYGPDQPGHAPGHGPAELSPVGLGIQGYIFVQQSGGILGIGSRDLYVPFSAIEDVTPDRVTLLSTKDQTENLYADKPDFWEE